MERKGMFITVEGLDGTGKSTSLNILRRLLAIHHTARHIIYTAEPAYTHAPGAKYSQMIRHLLLTQSLSKPLQASLFVVARKLHIEHVVKPALKHGDLVISSRGILSNLAYQGAYQDDFRPLGTVAPASDWTYLQHKTGFVDKNHILKLNDKNIGPDFLDCLPTVNFYFTMNPTGEKERLLGRSAKHDKFDAYLSNTEHIMALQHNYRCGIKELAVLNSPTVTIDASKYDQYQRAEIMYNWITKHLPSNNTDKNGNTDKTNKATDTDEHNNDK